MAKIKFTGFQEYMRKMEKMYGHSEELCTEALKAGCAVIGNAQKEAIYGIPTDPRIYVDGMRHGILPEAKQALIDSYGIAPVRSKNFVYERKTGFDGYNNIVTKRWPKGQPNDMVARSVESRTSFLPPYKFMDKVARSSQAEAETAMQDAIDKAVNRLWGN